MKAHIIFIAYKVDRRRSHWQRDLRLKSAAARLLRLRVLIPPGARITFSRECCVLPRRVIRDELITSSEESYRLWGVLCVI